MIERMDPLAESPVTPRWLHRLALLTVCTVLLALTSGAVVTTFRVGMADPIWPTYPWHLALISWKEPSPGFVIEHTHRLLDYLLGFCAILLAIGLWRFQPRPWLACLGVAALGGVIVQGLLGGFRVVLNALVGTDLALIHGLFGQLVFALLVSLALFTSPGWTAAPVPTVAGASRLGRWSVWTAVLVCVQLFFGALLRHTDSAIGQFGHILVAVAVVAAVAWLVKLVIDQADRERPLTMMARLLAALVAVQVLLGIEALRIRLSAPGLPGLQPVTVPQGILRTAHFVLGSLIFATAVVISLQARPSLKRQRRTAPHFADASGSDVEMVGRLEGAA